jgi:hypothetical protein
MNYVRWKYNKEIYDVIRIIYGTILLIGAFEIRITETSKKIYTLVH